MAALQYKTFSQLMATVKDDLEQYDDNNLILDRRYIKTARTCNATLGLKLNKKKEEMLEIEHFHADIPDDLLSAIAIIVYPSRSNTPCIPTITKRARSHFSASALNFYNPNPLYTVDSDSNQFHFNIESGRMEIGYICQMVDEDGNLLVLDHELTNDYYEWAVKEKIFTDLWHNNDADVVQKLQDARMQLSNARQRAINIVASPEYRTAKAAQRKAEVDFYNQYVKKFY